VSSLSAWVAKRLCARVTLPADFVTSYVANGLGGCLPALNARLDDYLTLELTHRDIFFFIANNSFRDLPYLNEIVIRR
jgi:hypothetical protein